MALPEVRHLVIETHVKVLIQMFGVWEHWGILCIKVYKYVVQESVTILLTQILLVSVSVNKVANAVLVSI